MERQRGRPRDPQIEAAILVAARDRLLVDGYARMTIRDVAADAGVGKPTVYRRWSNKQALVLDALDHAFRTQQSELSELDLDRMPPREAIAEAVRRLYGRGDGGRGVRVVAKILAEVDQTPELLDVLRQHGLLPRRTLFLRLLGDLQERGKLRAELDLELVADMCMGGYLSSYLITGEDDGDQFSARLVDILWPYLHGPAT